MTKSYKFVFKKEWIFFLIFILTTTIFFWNNLSGDAFFWEDIVEYVYPTQNYAAKISASGEVPFWSPYLFNGMPFYADLQVGFFYPLNRIFTFFVNSNDQLPFSVLQFVIILHFLIAQISFFLFARSWKISQWGSAIGAISYSFSLLMVCHAIHPMMLYHLAWFPLILLFFYKAVNTGSLKNSIYSGLLLGMVMLSGHPQMTLYISFFLLIVFIWQSVLKLKSGTSKIFILIISGVVPILIAAGIYSVQLLPSLELADLSQRADKSFELASEGSMLFKQAFTSIVPELFGKVTGDASVRPNFYLKFDGNFKMHYYWETAFYFGITCLILGLIGLFTTFKDNRTKFLLGIIIFAVFFALGSNSFLLNIFYNIPMFGTFRNPGRILFYLIFAFSVLAGFGFDNLKNKINIKILLSIILTPLIIAILISFGTLNSLFDIADFAKEFVAANTTKSIIIILITSVIIYLYNIKKLNQLIAGILLLLTLFIDLNIEGGGFNQSKNNPEEVYKLPATTLSSFKINPPDDIFRVNMRMYKPPFMAMKRNQGLFSDIMLVEGYNPLILEKVVPPLNTIKKTHDMLALKYEIKMDRFAKRPNFIKRLNPLSHSRFIYKYKLMNVDDIEEYMRNDNYDYQNEVVVEEDLIIKMQEINDSLITNSIKCLKYSPNEIEYEVETSENGIFLLSEIFYPAWNVYIDGKISKILRANYCLRAVEVPKGKYKISFKYESNSFYTGMWISILTIILSILGLVFSRKIKNKLLNN